MGTPLARRAVLLGLPLLAVTGRVAGAPRPRVAAHRGGAGLWPENSLTAFRGALGLGVDLLELDVHLSRDGEVVVLHDPTLERTTTGRGAVRDHPWAALREVTLRGTGDEPLPRLEDVLALVRPTRAGLLLEIKAGPDRAPYPGIEAAVVARLEAAGLLERTTVMAFDWLTLTRVRARAPGLRLSGLLSREGSRRLGWSEALRRLRDLGAHDLGLEWTAFAPDLPAAARALGLTVGVWTVNEPEALRRFLAAAVDYVTTDRPDLALALRAGG